MRQDVGGDFDVLRKALESGDRTSVLTGEARFFEILWNTAGLILAMSRSDPGQKKPGSVAASGFFVAAGAR